MKPGIYTMGAEEYHADPAEVPSLSASMACILVNNSPAHAQAAHPKLNPNFQAKAEEKYDIGTAAHSLLLEGVASVEVLQFMDWRTKDAKELRDLARAHGRIPLLAAQWDDLEAMVDATRAQLEQFEVEPPLFTEGLPEQTLVWEEAGVTCRARLDWLRNDHAAIDDYKTTSRSANPESWSRTLFNIGSDIQAAFYLRGLRAVTGAEAAWRWVVQETYPPYALSVIAPGPDVLALADAKVDKALAIWRSCLKHDRWPGYPREVCYAELPAWEEARFLSREDVAA